MKAPKIRTLFTIFFLSFGISVSSFAQNAKGLISANGGDWYMEFQGKSLTYPDTNISSKNNKFDHSVGFNNLTYCITDKLQIGGGLGWASNYRKDVLSQPNRPVQRVSSTLHLLSLSPSLRYYFLKKKNKTFFLEINSELLALFNKTTISDSSNYSNSSKITWAAALGYIKPINENLAWVNSLSFKNQEGNDIKTFSFNIGLQNFFTHLSDKNKSDAPPQFLAKNRSLFDGFLNLSYTLEPTNIINFSARFSQLKFINNNLAIGGSGSVFSLINAENADFHFLAGGVLVRYYVPFTRNWFFYPQIGYSLSTSINNGWNFQTSFSRNVGFNYFLNQNIALNINFNLSFANSKTNNNNLSQMNPRELRKSYNFNPYFSIGLEYFTDKIFRKRVN